MKYTKKTEELSQIRGDLREITGKCTTRSGLDLGLVISGKDCSLITSFYQC